MYKAIWARNTYYSKFLITVGIILLSVVFFTILSSVLATVIFGIRISDMEKMMSDLSNPLSVSTLKLVQICTAIGGFVIPPFILAYLFSARPLRFLSIDRKPEAASAIIVVAIMLVSLPLINFLGEINSRMHLPGFLKSVEDWMRESEDSAGKLTEAFLKMDSIGNMLLNVFMIALIPAIGEELVFRGIVQRLFQQWSKNAHVAVWTSAFLFSAIHMQFYGFLPRLILGAMLGYMLVWSGSLWLPIIGHFINNASAVVLTYLFRNELSSFDGDKIGTENDFLSVSISLLLVCGLIYILYIRRKNQNMMDEDEIISQEITS